MPAVERSVTATAAGAGADAVVAGAEPQRPAAAPDGQGLAGGQVTDRAVQPHTERLAVDGGQLDAALEAPGPGGGRDAGGAGPQLADPHLAAQPGHLVDGEPQPPDLGGREVDPGLPLLEVDQERLAAVDRDLGGGDGVHPDQPLGNGLEDVDVVEPLAGQAQLDPLAGAAAVRDPGAVRVAVQGLGGTGPDLVEEAGRGAGHHLARRAGQAVDHRVGQSRPGRGQPVDGEGSPRRQPQLAVQRPLLVVEAVPGLAGRPGQDHVDRGGVEPGPVGGGQGTGQAAQGLGQAGDLADLDSWHANLPEPHRVEADPPDLGDLDGDR